MLAASSTARASCGCVQRIMLAAEGGGSSSSYRRSAAAGPSLLPIRAPPAPQQRRAFSSTPAVRAKPRRERQVQDPFALRNMGKFKFDDVPTFGHAILDRQRELLKYARIVEWELPKLEALRKEYEPPSSDSILRFRSLHYQGEAHPATRKSVLTVQVPELFANGCLASQAAKRKFLLLAGVRWNPFGGDAGEDTLPLGPDERLDVLNDVQGVEQRALDQGTGSIKISCERFPEERQNLKWCSDAMDKLIIEANTNPEAMANVPLDLRSARVRETKRIAFARKQAPSLADFPAEWLPPQQQQQQ